MMNTLMAYIAACGMLCMINNGILLIKCIYKLFHDVFTTLGYISIKEHFEFKTQCK